MEKRIKKGDQVEFIPDETVVYPTHPTNGGTMLFNLKPGNKYRVEDRQKGPKGTGVYFIKLFGIDGYFSDEAFQRVEGNDSTLMASLRLLWVGAKLFLRVKYPSIFGPVVPELLNQEEAEINYYDFGSDEEAVFLPGIEQNFPPAQFGEKLVFVRGVEENTIDRIRNFNGGNQYTPKDFVNIKDFLIKPIQGMEPVNQYGIETTKAGMYSLAVIIKNAIGIDRDGDGKTTSAEAITFATMSLPSALQLFGQFGQIRNETKKGELTREEKDELIQHLISLDVLPDDGGKNDDIEEWIDDTIRMVLYVQRYIKNSIDLFKAKQEVEVVEAKSGIRFEVQPDLIEKSDSLRYDARSVVDDMVNGEEAADGPGNSEEG